MSIDAVKHSKGFLVVLLVSLIVRCLVAWFATVIEGNFPPMPEYLETYQDYKHLYLNDVKRFLDGEMLYKDFHNAYPPLWIYTLSAFVKINPSYWSAAVPLLLFDALIPLMVYLIARKMVGGKWAIAIGLATALSPASLWYNSMLWLNPPPSTFFLLLSTYLLVSKRVKISAASLALASLYKQTALASLPIFIIAAYWFKSKRALLWFIAIFAAIVVVGSMPYLALFPSLYLWALGFPGLPTPQPYVPEDLTVWEYNIIKPTNLGTIFGVFGAPWLAIFLRQHLIYIISAVFIVLTLLFLRIRGWDADALIRYLLYSQLLFILLFPRGTYKYFFNSALPYFALMCRKKGDLITFLAMNIGLLLVPRFFEPWFALVVMLFAYAVNRENLRMNSNKLIL
ncbi:MAG: hypothetical protein QXK20_02115 [Nitrososphaerales archaeon]